MVSSVLPRRGYRYQRALADVNDLLYMSCIAEEFIFMDNADITLDHISNDGVHPNIHGTTILKYNILNTFRTFNPRLFDFKDEYENSL